MDAGEEPVVGATVTLTGTDDRGNAVGPAVTTTDADGNFEFLAVSAGEPMLIIDLAADFRLRDPTVAEATYGTHPSPEALESFAFGLADVVGTSLEGATRVAVPGCFATAALRHENIDARLSLAQEVLRPDTSERWLERLEAEQPELTLDRLVAEGELRAES